MRTLWVVLLVLVGCLDLAWARKPQVRAKKIVDGQAAALLDDIDPNVLAASFAPDAVVAFPDYPTEQAKNGLGALRAGITGSMHAFISAAKVTSLTAGGDDKVVWIAAELELTIDQQTSETQVSTRKSTVRLTELATVDAKWKVIAAQFARLDAAIARDKDPPPAIAAPTSAGRLAKWAADPKTLSRTLFPKPTTMVFGTEKAERGIGGAAAKKLVDSWAKLQLELEGTPREVRTPHYGFLQANINWVKPGGPPYRMRVLMIGIPEPGGAWEIVLAHYAAP